MLFLTSIKNWYWKTFSSYCLFNVDTSIEKVKPENYKNYFEYAYRTTKKTEYTRKPLTRKHKRYKDV